MPLGVYLSEVYADDPTGSAQSIARGKITVIKEFIFWRRRCYDVRGVVTSLTAYVQKAGDFDQFTGLDGTNGQIWVADGSGSGAWALPSPGKVVRLLNVGAGTNVLVTGTAQFPIINTDGNLQTGINLNSSTGGTHTIQIAAKRCYGSG